MLHSTHQVNAEPRGTDSIDLNLLVYKFDARKPWQQFKEGHPVVSSVERGRRNLNSNRLKRVYLPKKKKTWIRRKNGAFKDLNQLQFTCCDSLLKEGLYSIKGIARQQRNLLYQKPYNEQNHLLSKLMEVELTFRGVRKISYHVPSFGKVCKTAFRKVYGMVLWKWFATDFLFLTRRFG